MTTTVTQENPVSLTLPHAVSHPVVKPAVVSGAHGDRLEEMPLTTTIHEFLFKVVKNGVVFWVGVAVPLGTTDFTRIQVFFHPTVVQIPVVHARDEDYPTFAGGWSSTLKRYIALQGGQLAASRRLPLLVPFTTMAALGGGAQNMFTTDPVGTLRAVTAAVQNAFVPFVLPPPELRAVGVTSFSSGISAMRMFIAAMKSSGLVREVIDLDSPFIVGEPADLTPSPGAVSSCYTQVPRAHPPPGYAFMPASMFAGLSSHRDVHARIGHMMYHTAMITSVVV
ncbi:hypothetical protein AB0M39_26630 [Streptomyces sp. NPDC051907]|uniref:hypothetical protein n=1 Tax=Streptomyces sp. NPDC051907 TaxID=3155284 RepID=UPI003447C1BC